MRQPNGRTNPFVRISADFDNFFVKNLGHPKISSPLRAHSRKTSTYTPIAKTHRAKSCSAFIRGARTGKTSLLTEAWC